MPALWEGARRLPYFFTWGEPDFEGRRSVICPQCALKHIETSPEFLRAHYAVNRTVMCSGCSILIGPMNDEEMVVYE